MWGRKEKINKSWSFSLSWEDNVTTPHFSFCKTGKYYLMLLLICSNTVRPHDSTLVKNLLFLMLSLGIKVQGRNQSPDVHDSLGQQSFGCRRIPSLPGKDNPVSTDPLSV